ncbi:MAG: hypothetical protein M1820_007037 [Bogoriella megaspora]|nr:MAG: hypothetical protein M1820_007037 [Bogoriella megaspora]
MQNKLQIALGALALLILYRVAVFFVGRRRHASQAKKLGCEAPPVYPRSDPFGFSTLRESFAASAKKRIPDLMIQRFDRMRLQEGRRVDTFGSDLLLRHNVITIDPKNIQAILAHQFKEFGLGEIRRGNFMPLLGHGIFTADGQGWEHSRAMLRPNFAREQVADLDLEERHVQNMMQALPVGDDGWTQELDIQKLFFRITIDTATEFLFGESVNSQLAELPNAQIKRKGQEESVFAAAFDRGQQWIMKRGRFLDFYWMINPKDFRDCQKDCHSFVDHYVQRALEHSTRRASAGTLEKGEKRERYVFLEALAEHTRDPIELRSQLLNILLAGRDTTASLLSWFFHLLIRNPDKMARLRAEILENLGTYENPRNLTFAGLKNCQYLQWCLNETLRLFPVVPNNSRQALKDTTIPRGGGPDGSSPIYIRKGQLVVYSVYALHRRPDIWGPDSDQFRPERWQGRKSGWEYLPFNGGPRICLGQQLALTEAGYVTVRLLQRFEKLEAGSNEALGDLVRQNATLTSCPNDGVWLRMKEAGR